MSHSKRKLPHSSPDHDHDHHLMLGQEPNVEDVLDLGMDMKEDSLNNDSSTEEEEEETEHETPSFKAPYERDFNLEEELPLFEELKEYMDNVDLDDPLRARLHECHKHIKTSKLVFKELWLTDLLDDADNKKELEGLKSYHLLLCLATDTFCRCEAATLKAICKQLALAAAVKTAIEEWKLEEEFPMVTARVTYFAHEQTKVWKSILFLARVYYALKTLKTEETAPDEDLMVVVKQVLRILEGSAQVEQERKNTKSRSRKKRRAGRPPAKQDPSDRDFYNVRDATGKFTSAGPKKRGPGRPPKTPSSEPPKKRGPGRPSKTPPASEPRRRARRPKVKVEEDDRKMPAARNQPTASTSAGAASASDDDVIRPRAAKLDGIRTLLESMLQDEESRHQQELDRHERFVESLQEGMGDLDELQQEAEESDEHIRVEIENQVKKKVMRFFNNMGA